MQNGLQDGVLFVAVTPFLHPQFFEVLQAREWPNVLHE